MNRAMLFSVAVVLASSVARGQAAEVVVDADIPIHPLNRLLFGINTARWDESLFPDSSDQMLLTADRDAIRKIRASGITILKYPGGNDADSYVWSSPSNSPSEMDTDEYIALCRAAGAEPFITVNFNESPELAASWVQYCNQQKGYNVRFWEVGDEQWGTWAKGHSSPEEYAKKYSLFVRAMKAVDPTIKVATNVPLGTHPENWTSRVLRAASKDIDMLTYTFFPQKWGSENDDTLLASVKAFRSLVSDLHKEVVSVVGATRANEILFVNVGYNSVNHSPGPQTVQLVNALWVADMLGTMAEVGTDIGCFWALHNAFPPRGGDYGYLSSEGSNTPTFSYYVFPMIANHLRGSMVSCRSSEESLSAYASREDGNLALALINKRKHESVVRVALHGFNPRSSGQAWILDESNRNVSWPGLPALEPRFTLRVPGFCLLVIQLTEKNIPIPPANKALSAEASASTYSLIGPSFAPEFAIDGKSYTRWNSAAWTKSNGEEKQWFMLQWKNPQTISKVCILWGESRGVDFRIEVSSDGATWKSVASVTNGSGPRDEFTMKEESVRYLRMSGAKGSKGISAYSIREVEVY